MHNDSLASLVPVVPGQIGRRETNIVSARVLHSAVGAKRVFSSWFSSRVEQYGFTRGTDFDQLTPERVEIIRAGRPEIDYVISLDMAKEMAMVERSEQGRSVRHYFIRCEEELHRAAPLKAAELREQMKARIEAASYFKPMCEALTLARAAEGKTTEPRHYANESNMIARIVLGGLTASQWAKSAGVTGEPRNHMTPEQLAHFAYLERSNITLIETGQTYPQRKTELIRLSQRWLTRLTGGEHA